MVSKKKAHQPMAAISIGQTEKLDSVTIDGCTFAFSGAGLTVSPTLKKKVTTNRVEEFY